MKLKIYSVLLSYVSVSLLLSTSHSAFAAADDKKVTTDVKVKTEVQKYTGWDKLAHFGANANLASNSNVIGKTDGLNMAFGYDINTGLFYYNDPHEWRNTLDLKASFARDASLKEFTKANDQITFDSLYLYRLLTWGGPFVRAGLETALFKGFDVQSTSKTYSITKNGATTTSTGNSLDLTDPFKPLTLKQSLGFLGQPIKEPRYTFEVRAGFGSRETFANDQLIVKDDATTPNIEVIELKNIYQAGSELAAQLSGKFNDNLEYKTWIEALTPFVSNKSSSDNRNALELTDIDSGVNFKAKIASWASLSYEFKAIKQPMLLDKFQYSNAVLFNLDYTLFEKIVK